MKQVVVLLIFLPVCTWAQVRFDWSGDTLKGNIRQMKEYGHEFPYPDSSWKVYTSDMTAKTESIICYDKDGTTIDKTLIQFDDAARIVRKSFFDDSGRLVVKMVYKHDLFGRKIEEYSVWYQVHESYNTHTGNRIIFDDSLAVLRQYRYDTFGHEIEEKEQTLSSPRHTNRVTLYRYDNAGRVAEKKYEQNSDDELYWRFAITNYIYDDKGRKLTEFYLERDKISIRKSFFSDGREVTMKVNYKYDSMDNLVETYVQMTNELSGSSTTKIGRTTLYSYDADHHHTSTTEYSTYQQPDGTISFRDSVFHQEPIRKGTKRQEYDSHGNLVKEVSDGEVIFLRKIEYY